MKWKEVNVLFAEKLCTREFLRQFQATAKCRSKGADLAGSGKLLGLAEPGRARL